eukprot:TRINITY_DN9691_c0_g1_i1.p1 TRINITY_DN9691_c0_g1~~TRINITY_DN9691_c0_g1_i1.p1  ORF type:complete len:246 (-),score=50.65 TRINITY_DN9691_c0_g1_i1:52-789(-)
MAICLPAQQCCCGCGLGFGVNFVLSLNLVRCLLYIFIAIDAVMHTTAEMKIQIDGTIGEKVCLATWGITGTTLTLLAFWGVRNQQEQAVRFCWLFLVFSYVVDLGLTVYENFVHDTCVDIKTLVDAAEQPFACGAERVLWITVLFLVAAIEGYFLFIVHSYCEDIAWGGCRRSLSNLHHGAEAHFLQKHLNPYNHLYGTVPSTVGFADAALVGEVPSHMGTYPIYGDYHDMQFPPTNRDRSGRLM